MLPLNKSTTLDRSGLPAPEQDPFHKFSTLELNYQALSPIDYEGDDYEDIRESLTHQIQNKPDSLLVAKALPNHLGMAFIASENSIDVTCFNITAQKELFENYNIELDPFFYQPSINELLALFIHNNKIFPVILHKSDFVTKPKPIAIPSKTEWDDLVASIKTPVSSNKVGRNEPCPCGSGKKYKKCCA